MPLIPDLPRSRPKQDRKVKKERQKCDEEENTRIYAYVELKLLAKLGAFSWGHCGAEKISEISIFSRCLEVTLEETSYCERNNGRDKLRMQVSSTAHCSSDVTVR